MSPLSESLRDLIVAHDLTADFADVVDGPYRSVAKAITRRRSELKRPMVVGLCGAQGGGKSTMAAFVSALLQERGLSAAVLSLDDLYLTSAERGRLASEVHPMLGTRGVPGTHDVALGVEVIQALIRAGPPRPVLLPRFDKGADDRAPVETSPVVAGPVDVVLFEGWCVGARRQTAADLDAPINALERVQDADGRWRRYANDQLAGDYQRLFGFIDFLILLKAPSFDAVFAWRALQERKLAARLEAAGETGRGVMAPQALATFIMHYERLTRHILDEMPDRADICVDLDAEHQILGTTSRRPDPGDNPRIESQDENDDGR